MVHFAVLDKPRPPNNRPNAFGSLLDGIQWLRTPRRGRGIRMPLKRRCIDPTQSRIIRHGDGSNSLPSGGRLSHVVRDKAGQTGR
jgi:hypothetical protein